MRFAPNRHRATDVLRSVMYLPCGQKWEHAIVDVLICFSREVLF